jgi:hypothetical protein
MKTLLFGLLLLTLLALPRNTQCRIGETLGECKTRYGNPVEIKKDAVLFFKNGMAVSVHLTDGKVDEIRYYKTNPKNSKKTICPSDAEMNILLLANAQDTSWELELAQGRDALWSNREKGLSAFRNAQALTISVADPAAYKVFHERKTAARELEEF